jgi:predicted amidohydrolase YtcJ
MTAENKDRLDETRIFINGTILTLDADNSTVEAVAVRNGRIEAVGPGEEVRQQITGKSHIVDLQGQTVIPGFIEAHGHFPFSGYDAVGVNLNSPPIGSMTRISEVLDALMQKATGMEKGKWVVGQGYDDTNLVEKRLLVRAELDEVSTDHPVFVNHISGHLGTANSLALEAAGFSAQTPDPEGGVICRDAQTGELTGELEETANFMVTNLATNLTAEENSAVIKWAVEDYAQNGVTTVQAGFTDERLLTGLSAASQIGQIPLRVIIWPDAELSENMIEGKFETEPHNTEFFQIGAAKIIGDGSIQGYTAHLTEPYHTAYKDDRDYRGYPVTERKAMVELVKKFHRAGMQIAIHGNGDATIDDIIYAVDVAQKECPRDDHRHMLIHSQTARYDQLDEMKRLGITPSFFSAHAYYWGDRHYNVFLGPERACRQNPARSALEKGIRFTIHLDTPVTPINPLLLVWSAVNRLSTGGNLIGEGERISALQALRATTIDAAWQIFQEDNRGSIEVGKLADLVILSENPLTVDKGQIKDIRVEQTIVGGRCVYKRNQDSA